MSFRTVAMQSVGGYKLRDGECWQDTVAELAAAASEQSGSFVFMAGEVPIQVDADSCSQLLEADVRFAQLGYFVGTVGPAPRRHTDGQRELIRQLVLLDAEHPDPNNGERLELVREHRLMVSEPQ